MYVGICIRRSVYVWVYLNLLDFITSNADQKSPPYVVFSTPLLPRPS